MFRQANDFIGIVFVLAAPVVGCGSCSGEPPGEPATEVLGIAMPEGTRRIHHEEGAGFDGLSFSNVWLASPQEPSELAAFFGDASGTDDPEAGSWSFDNDVRISIAPIDDIPTTSFPPVQPIVDDEPNGMNAWITAYHEVSGTCPPCPDDFEGTTVPGCYCEGPAGDDRVDDDAGVVVDASAEQQE